MLMDGWVFSSFRFKIRKYFESQEGFCKNVFLLYIGILFLKMVLILTYIENCFPSLATSAKTDNF